MFKVSKNTLKLYIFFVIIKIAIEYVYYTYNINGTSPEYVVDVNAFKYLYGMCWLTVLFFGIRHDKRLPSTFIMQFFLVMQVIPLTVIYAFQNENTLYYTVVCMALFMAETVLAMCKRCTPYFFRMKINWWIIGSIAMIIALVVYIYINNGLPTLMALNFDNVYKLRESGIYKIGKYTAYLQDIVTKVVIPVSLAGAVSQRKYICAGILYFIEAAIYLYTGSKGILFAGLLVIFVTMWSRRPKFTDEIWTCATLGLGLVGFGWKINWILYKMYDLFIRRSMIVPAINSYRYYDFFKENPRLGLAGIFPNWLLPINNPYARVPYAYVISKVYYNKPEMNSNNGFLGEASARFGLGGIFLEFFIFIMILMLVDSLQEKTSYTFAVGASIYFVYSLADAHLIDQLLCGYWMPLVLFFGLYGIKNKERKNNQSTWKDLTMESDSY